MVIDTSALIAIFLEEPESERFFDMIAKAEKRLISAATAFETGMVLEGKAGTAAGREFDLFMHEAGLELVPVDRDQVDAARIAWRKYGKGNHPAALNFGDCFSYALAKLSREPLLAKGKDFSRTDIELL